MPIFSSLAADIGSDSEVGTRVLAIYPMSELLKDQLRELIAALVPFNKFLVSQGLRPITVGSLFADTPNNNFDREFQQKITRTHKCPDDECDGFLDIVDGFNLRKLRCKKCDYEAENTVVVTRQEMKKSPPDILLTSAEMLSQRITDRKSRHLFGIHPKSRLKFVLMDEIHTYGV